LSNSGNKHSGSGITVILFDLFIILIMQSVAPKHRMIEKLMNNELERIWNEKPQSGRPVSRPRIEPNTSEKRYRFSQLARHIKVFVLTNWLF
jgi:hypothetical protein